MIWGYHYFWKHPYLSIFNILNLKITQCVQSGKKSEPNLHDFGFHVNFPGCNLGKSRRFFWHVGAHVFCFRDLIYPSSHLSVDMMTLIAFYEGQESKHLDSLHCSFKIGKLWKLTILYTMTITKSGQIIIIHQARFPCNKGISLTKPPFGVRSCEVAIIWPD